MAPIPAEPDRVSVRAPEDRVRKVLEASPTALVLVDKSGRIELVNERAERMFGYGTDEMLDQPLEALLPQRYRDSHAVLRDRFHLESSMRPMGLGREIFGSRKDGSEFPLEIGLNPLVLDGVPMVLAGIIDITSRRDFEREKEERQRELERSNADLEEFAYVASHDLKAPLRALGHLADWIREDVQATASEETLENLALLKGRVSRLQKLLDGLLTYSRLGRGNLSPEEVNVADMVIDIGALLGGHPRFSVVFEGPEQILHTHRAPLRAVLENLISNALKHHDRETGDIRVAMRRADGEVQISVADDGPGIPPRHHERIFQIFQTMGGKEDRESSGIGLAIVKKQVGAHGGSVQVRSDPPSRGTTFVFTWKEA